LHLCPDVQRRYICLLLLRFTPDGGVPCDDLLKILHDSQRVAMLQIGVDSHIAENFNRLSRDTFTRDTLFFRHRREDRPKAVEY